MHLRTGDKVPVQTRFGDVATSNSTLAYTGKPVRTPDEEQPQRAKTCVGLGWLQSDRANVARLRLSGEIIGNGGGHTAM